MKEPYNAFLFNQPSPISGPSARTGIVFKRSRLHVFYRMLLAALVVICAFMQPLHASPQDAWQKANRFYQQKEYDSAAFYFEQVAAPKPADPAIYYNLGNTYYRLNDIGKSVLNYERALKRKPDYKEAADNLLLARSRIPARILPVPDIFFVSWWKTITAPGYIMLWSVASLLLFILLIGLLLYKKLNKGKIYIRPQYTGGLTLLWLVAILLAFSASKTALTDIRGVVMTGDVILGNADKNAKNTVAVPEGTTVRLLSLKGTIYEVELPDGRTGYLQQADVARVD